MSLTTHPFHPVTGDLLPSHRDAYLRGDLSGHNADLVDAYLKANPAKGDEAMLRFHALRAKGHAVRPVGWMQNQFHLMRTEPKRFRQRAATLVVGAALLGGAVFAGNTAGEGGAELPVAAGTSDLAVATEAAAAKTMSVVSGRILDENGRPLIGATILDKTSGRGVTTNAQGSYSLLVPANQPSRLQFAYGGYSEEEVQVKGRSTHNVTLLPRTDDVKKTSKRRWLFF